MGVRRGRLGIVAVLVVLAMVSLHAPLSAQQSDQSQKKQVISANPFGLLLELFNAEYERVVTESSTAGIVGSTFSADDERYLNVDLFWRYYPAANPLDGWSFGGKIGVTSVSDSQYFGFGFDVGRSWLLGANDDFYVGLGVGLKRLVGTSDDDDFDFATFIPTLRLVNIGFAF